MAEIFVEFHNVPAGREEEVRAVLRKHGFPDVDVDANLYGDQFQTYDAGKYESEEVCGALAALECSFDLVYRSEYDGAIYYDPELGRYEEEHGEDGDAVVPMVLLHKLARLDTVEEVRALIAKETGTAWADKFATYEQARALYGHCDTCGAGCDEHGCTVDRSHVAAIPG